MKKFRACEDLDICLKQLYSNRHLAVAASLKHAQNSRLIPASEIYCFEDLEKITEYPVQILVRKDFPFFDEFNTFINIAKANGLISKWLTETRVRPDYEFQEVHYDDFSIDNFGGFFVFWLTLFIVPMLVCVAETLIFRGAQKINPRKIFILLEMVIDGNRYFLLNDVRFEHKSIS